MKRQANPQISSSGEFALTQYEQTLREREDLTIASVRNYLSDVRHFIAWYEQREAESECALGYIVKKYAGVAKLPDVSPHDLRHRFGYRMAESVPLHRLAQIMGHDSLDTTKLYIQGTKHDLQQAVETIAWT